MHTLQNSGQSSLQNKMLMSAIKLISVWKSSLGINSKSKCLLEASWRCQKVCIPLLLDNQTLLTSLFGCWNKPKQGVYAHIFHSILGIRVWKTFPSQCIPSFAVIGSRHATQFRNSSCSLFSHRALSLYPSSWKTYLLMYSFSEPYHETAPVTFLMGCRNSILQHL